MDRFTLSLVVGAAAGALVAIPMIAQKATFRHCFAAFCVYLFAAVITFYSDLPYLPWWADGMGVALMVAIPAAIVGSGKESRPVPTTQNSYLDVLCRDVAEEKNFDVVMNERFASYVKEMQDTYEYIVINSPNVAESADAFAAGKLCDKNFVVCARGGVNNETLYRLKNEAAVQGIVLEGVLVYEL